MNNIIYAGKHLLTLSVNRHTHSSWELIYCTSGSGVMQFDDFELPYKTGDIVAIPPMMPHANVSSEGFSNYHINMSDLVPVSSEPILMHDDSNAFLLNVFEAAYFHFNSAPEKRDAFLPHYGDLLVSYMSQSQHQVKVSKVVEEIQTNIIQNYPDCNYELDKFLQSFPFSYDYLRKLFKKELGITPPTSSSATSACRRPPICWFTATTAARTSPKSPSSAATASRCTSPACSKRSSASPPATIWIPSWTVKKTKFFPLPA